ncbi:hypothetical protein A3D77_07890 [Candidatus Gottesmanbacteria bacterium RIFCSPHIGHO2_02_FULL_39_11]|uniref:Addiction module toxin, HicA family n=1 Tax=Candidatus Gottesmanbacteria bacterium RIFCSPHIGHO2_02_FULL_39_11 TaxID=1798382 RepID=A0A1F5ZTF9_9BACT|nr:MAG: hypothetical protein A3D77_07890 [Candidatus Gottesmanbacteria bacterium RIFCSPHIGHO2_02_FULL_39_11]
MPKLPVLKPREMISFLEKHGFQVVRSDGSHFRFHHPDGRRTTVAFHNKPLKRGTLKSILRQSELTTDDLVDFLHKNN